MDELCDCEFCCGLAEGEVDERGQLCLTLPARLLAEDTHKVAVIKKMAPADGSVVAEFFGSEYRDWESLATAMGSQVDALVVKVHHCDGEKDHWFAAKKDCVDCAKPRAVPNLTDLQFVKAPKMPPAIEALPGDVVDQVRKRQRVLDRSGRSSVLSADVDQAAPAAEMGAWSFEQPAATWTASAVMNAIFDADPARDQLPPLAIKSSENDGGYWCEMVHPVTNEKVKLLLHIIALARWKPYAALVEDFEFGDRPPSGFVAVLRGGGEVRMNH